MLPRIEPDATLLLRKLELSSREQIRRGAPVDVYLSASPIYTQALYREGLVRKPVAFATNSLVIIVPRSNPAKIKTVYDLAKRPKLRLVVAGPKVPIGLYTREVLKRLGLLQGAEEDGEPRAGREGNRRQGRARRGRCRIRLPDRRRARGVACPRDSRFPPRSQPTVIYELAIAAKPSRSRGAQAFVIAVLGPDGRRELRAARLRAAVKPHAVRRRARGGDGARSRLPR